MSIGLVNRESLTEMVQAWNLHSRAIRQALDAIEVSESKLKEVFEGQGRYFSVRDSMRYHGKNTDSVLEELERDAWKALFERMEVRQFLSCEASKRLDLQLEGKAEPLGTITLDAVLGTLSGLHRSIPDLAAESVREVFDFLRPPRSKLKTNQRWKVGKKVILRVLEPHDKRWTWTPRVNYHWSDNLRALDRVFHLLDGQGYVSKSWGGQLVDAVTQQGETGETKYFKFRCCKNGNLHVEFRRPDLVRLLNEVAGGKRLTPAEDKSGEANRTHAA